MSINLYNGDCIEIMNSLIKEGVKVDAIITDIPYGTTSCDWDVIIPFDKMWECIHKISNDNTAIALFGNEPFSSLLRSSNIKEFKYDIYWQKERPTNVLQVKRRPGKVIEIISLFYKKQPTYNPQMTIYNGPKRGNKIKDGKLGLLVDSGNRKPNEYIDNGLRYPLQLVQFKRDIVLDFTMGSGTTGVACKNLNRNFIGIELDVNYFNIAKERISN